MGRRVVRVCRLCGCTDTNACVTVEAKLDTLKDGKYVVRAVKSSQRCYWIEEDLCSACEPQTM
jgi:hypothetical protein